MIAKTVWRLESKVSVAWNGVFWGFSTKEVELVLLTFIMECLYQ